MKKIILITAAIAVILIISVGLYFFLIKAGPQEKEQLGWKEYKLEVTQFGYPSDWLLEEHYYQFPDGASVVAALTVYKEGGTTTDQDAIHIGSIGADCQALNIPRCYAMFNVPFYTSSQDPIIIEIFNSILSTVQYVNPAEAFIINSPEKDDRLTAAKKYEIKWETKQGYNIPKVRIIISNASNYWQEGLVLAADGVANDGSFEWTTPANPQTETPYFVQIYSCEYTVSETSCAPRIGWSEPFYIGRQQR